jgi:hypothetical protein
MANATRRETLKHLRELLTRTTDEEKCQRIVKQIEEEEAKKRGK